MTVRVVRRLRSAAMSMIPAAGMISNTSDVMSLSPPITLVRAKSEAIESARPRVATRVVVKIRGPVHTMTAALRARIAIVRQTQTVITRRAQGLI
jgi:hypothetical protein